MIVLPFIIDMYGNDNIYNNPVSVGTVFIGDLRNDLYYSRFEKVANNLFIDIKVDSNNYMYGLSQLDDITKEEKDIIDNYIIKEIDRKINECKSELLSNPNKAITYAVVVATHLEDGKPIAVMETTKFLTDIEFYNNEFLNQFIRKTQQQDGGVHYNNEVRNNYYTFDEEYITKNNIKASITSEWREYNLSDEIYKKISPSDNNSGYEIYNANTGEFIKKVQSGELTNENEILVGNEIEIENNIY